LEDLVSNLLFTDTHLWEVDAIDGPSWAVSVEFTLHLCLPLFVFLCLRQSWRWNAVIAVGCFVVLTVVSVLNHRWDGGVAGEVGTLDTRLMYFRCGPEFALGMLCWRLWREVPWASMFGRPLWLAGLVLALLAMTPFKALDLPFVLATCLLIVGLTTGQGWIAAAFGSRIPHWLGTISYSVYLWHEAWLTPRAALLGVLPDGDAGRMIANTLGLVVVLAGATLSYRWFEVPVRAWTNRLVPKAPHAARVTEVPAGS
jgi:peptidoglycan/LPS O-acetylase OafA/YrhL